MKLKILINYLIFCFLTILIIFSLSKIIYINKNYFEANLLKTIYYDIKPNSIDVLVIGPSTAETAWNPLVAWKECGITSLNYSFSNLPISIVKNIITDFLKRQKPKVILIDVNSLVSYNINGGNGRKYFFYYIFHKIPFSVNKIKILNTLTKYYNLNLEDFICSIFPLIATHDNAFLDNIKQDGLCLAYMRKQYFNRNNIYSNISYTTMSKFQEDNVPMEYLEDLFNFCKKLDIPVVFIGVPTPLFFTKPYNTIPMRHRYDSFFSLIKERNFDYINANQYYAIRDLKLSYRDGSDSDHLNFWGSKKFTKYISKIIAERYNLEDKKNNPDYSFWNETTDKYIKDVKEKCGVKISI